MFTCWFYRRRISECIDSDRAVPRQVQEHLQRCQACQRFYDAGVRVGELLVAGAENEKAASPTFLQGRILAALDRSDAGAPRGILRPAWPAAVLVLSLLLVGFWFGLRQQWSERQQSPQISSAQNPSAAAGLLAAAAKLPSEDKLREWGQKLDQPLEKEMQSVFQDARTALAGLAHNFLPDELSPVR